MLTLGQLKILQEVITLSVFVPFAYFYMDQPSEVDYLWVALSIVEAVFFVSREQRTDARSAATASL